MNARSSSGSSVAFESVARGEADRRSDADRFVLVDGGDELQTVRKEVLTGE